MPLRDDQAEREQRAAVFKRSAKARTRQEHLDAAHELLGLTNPHAIYVITPVHLTMAQTHAALAAVT